MSIRYIGTRLFRHGQTFVRHICRRDYNINITETVHASQQAATSGSNAKVVPRNFALRNVGVQVGLHARRILIDNVLNRVTNSLAADLRKKAARRILYGDSGTFLALVGVSLASGTGIITKEEEMEGVCLEIREAISKIKWKYHESGMDESQLIDEKVSVKNLSFGDPIEKGANAVVYAAKIAKPDDKSDKEKLQGNFVTTALQRLSAKKENKDNTISNYPLAVKMMFNYDIQSSAMAILRAMYKETIPARMYYSNVGINDWEIELSSRKAHLPPHPNVVAMFSVFTDYVPELKDAKNLYPAALPSRIYSDGEGRNMSLFLIMKRYDLSLKNYVKSTPTMRTSTLLFAQLLEGVAHLTAHGIAHRDLKSDNLLLDTSESHAPILVISDFGCCLADRSQSLLLKYSSSEIDKGGNTALMAPEIINQTPGTFTVLNYTKSDLWAAGAIAYEIFGRDNPFYASDDATKLRSTQYNESDLPDLPEDVPVVVQLLVRNLLKRHPNKRLDPEIAANVMQVLLWAPSAWLQPGLIKLPTSGEILQWLLSLTTKVLCEGRLNNEVVSTPSSDYSCGKMQFGDKKYSSGRRTYTEYLLISSFLVRAKLSNIKAALSWIHNNL